MLDGQQLADKVKTLRKSCGLTLEQVAKRAGTTKSHVWEIEQGKSVNPTIKLVGGLCRAFGVSMVEFLSDPEPRSHEFMVTMGCDAMRMCLGMAPVNHQPKDIIRWIEAQAWHDPALERQISNLDDSADARRVA